MGKSAHTNGMQLSSAQQNLAREFASRPLLVLAGPAAGTALGAVV